MPIGTPEFYTQLGMSLLRPQQWQLYHEPDPFAFIVQNLIAALMLRKGIRQQAIRDFMDWMTKMSPDVAVQWLENPILREFVMKQTGLKEKDLQRIKSWLDEMLVPEREVRETIEQTSPQPQPEQPSEIFYPPHMPILGEPTLGFAPPSKPMLLPTVPISLPFPFIRFPFVLYQI
jgi:hypothetical protein